jgi:hypothetical protein
MLLELGRQDLLHSEGAWESAKDVAQMEAELDAAAVIVHLELAHRRPAGIDRR